MADLPLRRYYSIKVNVNIGYDRLLDGYVSISGDEVVSITMWPTKDKDFEITLYKYDRLVAGDENPENIKKLSTILNIYNFGEVAYSSMYILAGGTKVDGVLRCI